MRKILFFLISFLLMAQTSFADIGFVSKETAGLCTGSVGPGDCTFEHTLSAQDNGLLIVTIYFSYEGTPATDQITGVTWNGDAMTKFAYNYNTTGGDNVDRTSAWYILSPDAVTGNLVISHNKHYGGTYYLTYYSGVKQQAPEATTTSDGHMSGGGAVTPTALSVLTDGALVYVHYDNGSLYMTNKNTGFTIRYPTDGEINVQHSNSKDTSDYIKTSLGSQSFSYDTNGATYWWFIGASFAKDTGVAGYTGVTLKNVTAE